MCPPATRRQKTRRAFRAYLDLVDTAEWFVEELRGQIECFDLTMEGFRLLEMLYRDGPTSIVNAAKMRRCKRQNMHVIVARLAERGWVRARVVRLPAAKIPKSRLPKDRRDRPRKGRRIGFMMLTPLGTKFVENFLPKHTKIVKAMMRALDGREQETLIRLCAKLREGDVVKWWREMTYLCEEDGEVDGRRRTS
jgi:DNA-binding MarR family transcriptional regulator